MCTVLLLGLQFRHSPLMKALLSARRHRDLLSGLLLLIPLSGSPLRLPQVVLGLVLLPSFLARLLLGLGSFGGVGVIGVAFIILIPRLILNPLPFGGTVRLSVGSEQLFGSDIRL